jgi:transcriptional regulator with XRE-family HTH domain
LPFKTNSNAKLIHEQITSIRSEVGFTQKELAIKYNVSQSSISNILSKKSWT